MTTRPASSARADAVRRLIDKHKAEFETYMEQAHEERGLSYTPNPTPEDRARTKIHELLDKNPGLKAEFGSGLDEFRKETASV